MEWNLYEAATTGNVESLKEMVEKDSKLLKTVGMECLKPSPLHVAASRGHKDFVRILLELNPELAEAIDSRRRTPLHLAAAKNHLDIVQELVNVNREMCSARDIDGRNPLHVAAMNGEGDVLEYLASVCPRSAARARTDRGETILHLSFWYNHMEALKLLLHHNNCQDLINAKDDDGNTVLHLAVAKHDKGDVLEYLVSECPQAARARTDRGETILHLSFKYNRMEALKLLLHHNECQDLVNAKDDDGNTILHLAVANHNYQVVKLLLSCDKTNASPTNAEGKTPLDVVKVARGKKNKSSSILPKKDKSSRHSQKPDDILLCSAALRKANAKKAKQPGKVKWLTEKRDSLMVVASLIATMAFQAGVSPPGGVWADDSNGHRAGETVMAYNYPHFFPYFLRLNTVGFVGSLSTILLLISELPFKRKVFMWILVVIMWVTITSTAFTYSFAITVVTPMKYRASLTSTIKIGVLVWSCVMVVLLLVHTVRLMVKLIKEFKTKYYVSKSMKKKFADADAIADEAAANV